MADFLIKPEQEHLDKMKMASNAILEATLVYLKTYPEPSKSFLGRTHICQKQALSLKTLAETFQNDIENTGMDSRLSYFFFTRDFIGTLRTIPENDTLKAYLEKSALNQFHSSLNHLMRYDSANTSQNYLDIYVTLIKDRFKITDQEEHARPSAQMTFSKAG